MSPKRLIIILVVFASLATVLVGFAAGSGGKDERRDPRQQKGAGAPPAPTKSSPRQNPSATMKYWTPDRMKRARPLPMGIPGGGTQPGGPDGSGSTAPSRR